jgi:nitroreductase
MEFTEVIQNRRAVRSYTEVEPGPEVVDRLIEAAILAPSAMNRQPWSFAVMPGRNRVNAYAQRAKSWVLEHLPESGEVAALRPLLSEPAYQLFHHAPMLVLVLARSAAQQDVEDCCLAAQNLMLAARDEGLGSCWIGLARPWLNLPEIKAELGLPAAFHVVAPIVVGFPREWPESHGRKPAEVRWLET